MNLENVATPEIYRQSADFRMFMKLYSYLLELTRVDTENLPDLIDPERCPKELLKYLADTVGFDYNSNMTPSYNRLILLYFMSMINNRGSRNGMLLAAELNLAQFDINNYAAEDGVYEDRLKDSTIPVNSAYVTAHKDKGYIDVVYYSENNPVDACIEYVRPLGMYCFTHPGVRVDSRLKISIDARLADIPNQEVDTNVAHIGRYTRRDYSSMQKMVDSSGHYDVEKRSPVYYRNSEYERHTSNIDPGLRSLYSLQLSNNDHIVKSLIPSAEPIFKLGYDPQVDTFNEELREKPSYNLTYNKSSELSLGEVITTIDEDRSGGAISAKPVVNPVMSTVGDSIALNDKNTLYTKSVDGEIIVEEK